MVLLRVLSIIILGWVAGLLVNYLSDVLPARRRLAPPLCLHCGARFALVNYLLWPRRCHVCRTPRNLRAWVVDLLYILCSLWLWYAPPERLGYLAGLVLLIFFGVVVVIDLEHRLILHMVSLVGAALGLGLGTWMHGFWPTILGGLAGFGLMLGFYGLGIVFVRLWARLRKQPLAETEGLGFGDVNLAGVVGLLLGWPGVVAGLVLAILLGGAASLIVIVFSVLARRYHAALSIAYGPFLVLAAVILLYLKKTWFL